MFILKLILIIYASEGLEMSVPVYCDDFPQEISSRNIFNRRIANVDSIKNVEIAFNGFLSRLDTVKIESRKKSVDTRIKLSFVTNDNKTINICMTDYKKGYLVMDGIKYKPDTLFNKYIFNLVYGK